MTGISCAASAVRAAGVQPAQMPLTGPSGTEAEGLRARASDSQSGPSTPQFLNPVIRYNQAARTLVVLFVDGETGEKMWQVPPEYVVQQYALGNDLKKQNGDSQTDGQPVGGTGSEGGVGGQAGSEAAVLVSLSGRHEPSSAGVAVVPGTGASAGTGTEGSLV